MADVNLVPNPAAGAGTLDGWNEGAFPDVRGTLAPASDLLSKDYPRDTGVQIFQNAEGSAFTELPLVDVTPNVEYTFSAHVATPPTADPQSVTIWIEWLDADEVYLSSPSVDVTLEPTDVVQAAITGTAPAGAAYGYMAFNTLPDTTYLTAALAYPGGTVDPYRDGESTGWQWDGTRYLSTSSLADDGGDPDPEPPEGTRRNLTPNPAQAAGNEPAWYAPTGSPGRVTGLTGMTRSTGYSTVAGSSVTARWDVVPGQTYASSIEVDPGYSGDLTIGIDFYDESGFIPGGASTTFTVTDGQVQRVGIVVVAPAAAVEAVSPLGNSGGSAVYTAHLAEQADTLRPYFDGDTPGAVWDDGAPPSTSTIDADPLPDTAAERYGWGTPLPASDEFDYTGPPDPARWGVYNGPGHDGNGTRDPDQVTVQNGYLRLAGNATGDTGGLAQQFDQRYGRWEMRARWDAETPGSGGDAYHVVFIVWPDGGLPPPDWPQYGEYDFVEIVDVEQTSLQAYLHYPHPGDVPVEQEIVDADPRTFDFSQWHNYAFEWVDGRLRGFVDGDQWFDLDGTQLSSSGDRLDGMPSGHLAIQLDNFTGDSGLQPAYLDVEWARVYPADGSVEIGFAAGEGVASASASGVTSGRTTAGPGTASVSADATAAAATATRAGSGTGGASASAVGTGAGVRAGTGSRSAAAGTGAAGTTAVRAASGAAGAAAAVSGQTVGRVATATGSVTAGAGSSGQAQPVSIRTGTVSAGAGTAPAGTERSAPADGTVSAGAVSTGATHGRTGTAEGVAAASARASGVSGYAVRATGATGAAASASGTGRRVATATGTVRAGTGAAGTGTRTAVASAHAGTRATAAGTGVKGSAGTGAAVTGAAVASTGQKQTTTTGEAGASASASGGVGLVVTATGTARAGAGAAPAGTTATRAATGTTGAAADTAGTWQRAAATTGTTRAGASSSGTGVRVVEVIGQAVALAGGRGVTAPPSRPASGAASATVVARGYTGTVQVVGGTASAGARAHGAGHGRTATATGTATATAYAQQRRPQPGRLVTAHTGPRLSATHPPPTMEAHS